MATRRVVIRPEDPSKIKEGSLPEIRVPSEVPGTSVDLLDLKQQYEIEQIKQRLDREDNRLAEAKSLHTLRKVYSGCLFGLVVVWVLTVWFILICQGFGKLPGFSATPFRLSDTVLIAYITSTTASILGLFGIAAYWMFGRPKTQATKPVSNKSARRKKSGS